MEKRLVKRVVHCLWDLVYPHEALRRVDKAEPVGLLEALARTTTKLAIRVHGDAISPKYHRAAQARESPAIGFAIERCMVHFRRCGGDDLGVCG